MSHARFLSAALCVVLAASLAAASTKVNFMGEATAPAITPGPNGGWIVIVYEGSTVSWTVSRFDRYGQRTYGPVQAEWEWPKMPFGSTVAWNGTNIGWVFDTTSVIGGPVEIWFHLLDPDGKLASTPVYVSPSSSGLQPCCADIVWAGGEWLVGYVSDTTGGYPRAITMRRLTASGAVASAEMLAYSNPSAILGWPQVGRVGGALAAFWQENQGPGQATRGTWLDVQGNVLVPAKDYIPVIAGYGQGPTQVISLEGAVSVHVVKNDQTTGETLPLEQIQVESTGDIVLGPLPVVESIPLMSGFSSTGGSRGYGISLRAPVSSSGQVLLRRIAFDGLEASQSFQVSDVPGGRGVSESRAAYMGGAYGVLWLDNREVFSEFDAFFDVAPAFEVLAIGAGPAPSALPDVKLFRPEDLPSGAPIFEAAPYAASGYGANVGAGDIDGDEADELLTAPGPGAVYGPQVRAFTGRLAPRAKVNFYAYGTLRYGARVAGADLDADGYGEILTTPGPGAVFGPHVRSFQFDNASISAMGKVSFYAYGTLRYGAVAAGGDVDADGYAEILTGPGPGAVFSSQLRGFNFDNATVQSMGKINTIVFPGGKYGLEVAAGETDGEDFDEIGCAPGPDPAQPSTIVVYDYDGTALSEKAGSRFEAFAGALGGARLAFAQWWDKDLARELLASRGPLSVNVTEVRAFDDPKAAFGALQTFTPYPGQTHGSTMAALATGF